MLRNLTYKLKQLYLNAKIAKRIIPYFLFSKVTNNLLKNAFHLYAPSSAALGLTYRCQCECIHCSAGSYKKETEQELKTKEWFLLLDDICGLGVPRINITGGEALLRKDIFEIIGYASKKFVVILESNGQLLTPQNIKYLKKSKVSCVAVSIDNHNAFIHDRLRRLNGCFHKAIDGIKQLVANNIPCLMSTYVIPERLNRRNVSKIMEMAMGLGVLAVRVLPPRPAGSFACQSESLLSKEQEQELLKYINPKIAYFKGMPVPKKCGIFYKSTFYISPYGEVQPCPYLSLSFGITRNNSLPGILERMWSHDIFSGKPKDCLILNNEFRESMIMPHLGKMGDKGIFPVKK